DPHRFRRLPGDVIVGVAPDRRTRGHLPLASRRRHGGTFAGARDRDSGIARRRYFNAARRVPEASGLVRGNRTCNAIVVALGRALETRLRRTGKRGFRPVRDWSGRRRVRVALCGILQGGDALVLRAESARALTEMAFQGYAIGGLAVGEPQEVMLKIVAETTPMLPADRPRYLMCAATAHDLLEE